MFANAVKEAEQQMGTLEQKFEEVSRPATRIMTADNKEIYRVSEENRIPLKLADIPVHVRNAIIAAEDIRFYSHNGVDYKGLGRAFTSLFEKHRISGGGSTITMQLAKRLYNGDQQTFKRKMQDIAFAYEIEKTVANKNKILELYMNQVYFGEGAHGIGAAAKVYLNKEVKDLTISEAALLARCVRIPNKQNPIRSYDVAMENRDVVLNSMHAANMITDEEYDKALKEKPKIAKTRAHSTAFYTGGYGMYFIRHVLDLVEADNPGIDLKSGGYTIYTTIDSHLQRHAEEAVRRVVAAHRHEKINQGAFVAADSDGKILCEVGGVDFHKDQFNIVAQGRMQPGSGFKPIVYATALKEGAIGPNDMISNAPYKDDWPQNSSPRENQSSYSVASAIALSINRSAVNTIMKVGPQTVVQYAHDFFGYRSKLDPYPSLALGAMPVSPLENIEAYSVFMLRGDRIHPYPVTRVVGPDGDIVKEYYPQRFSSVFDPTICDEMDGFLVGVVQHGTGTHAQKIPDARGKTGTTNEAKDAWFNGYAQGIIGVSWCGNEQRDKKGKMQQLAMGSRVFGGTTAVDIWVDVMKEAVERFGKKPAVVDVPPRAPRKPTEPTIAPDATEKMPPDGDVPPGTVPDGKVVDPDDPNAHDPNPGATKPDTAPLPTDTIPDNRGTKTTPPPGDVDNPPVKPKPTPEREPKVKGAETVSVEVCATSGQLATSYCPETVTRTFPRGKQPRRYCTQHGPGG